MDFDSSDKLGSVYITNNR